MSSAPQTTKPSRMIGAARLALAAFALAAFYAAFDYVVGFGVFFPAHLKDPGRMIDRKVRVVFRAEVDPALPWTFNVESPPLTVRLGEVKELAYSAVNHGVQPYKGVTVYRVYPERAGAYFNKIECYCFDQRLMLPKEKADFTVQFFVDPAMNDDPAMKDVEEITLAYSFYMPDTPAYRQAKTAFKAWQKELAEIVNAKAGEP